MNRIDIPLPLRIKNYIRQRRLINPGETVLAAVSGGVDSMALLHLLFELSEEMHFSLAAAHFDHQLRPTSASEGDFVQRYCELWNIPCYRGNADVKRFSIGKNLEDTARQLRYQFLYDQAADIGADKIATAHHAQDQAETLLLHLLRGSGPDGLAAISPFEGILIRPLLEVYKEDLREYERQTGFGHCEDESNMQIKYLRNKIRLQLMPVLEEYNPHLVERLCDTAEICREESAFLNQYALEAFNSVWLEEGQSLCGKEFDALPLALQRRVLRLAYVKVLATPKNLRFSSLPVLTFNHIEAILKLKEEQSLDLPGDLLIYRRGNIYFGKEKPALLTDAGNYQLIADNKWQKIGGSGWSYLAWREEGSPQPCLKDTFVLDASSLGGLYFRTRREGDFMFSCGKKQKKKLKEIFIDESILPYQRASWPILIYKDEIIWVPLLRKKKMDITDNRLLYIKILRNNKV